MIKKKAKTFVLITILIWMLFLLFNSVAIAEEGLVVIVVNSTLQPFIQPSLNLYVSDVETEGYTVEVKSWNLAGSTPQELKDYLISKQSDGLIGAFFVGDLPIANFYHADDFNGHSATFPCDLYYMNLDGLWTDSNSDGTFDMIAGDRNPQIWLGRLIAGNLPLMGTEEDIVNNYFAKVHAYKTKTKQVQRRACSLIYEDWSPSRGETMGNIYTDYETVAGDTFTTTTYEAKLNAGYEFIFLCAHSNSAGHTFNDGWFSNANIPTIDPEVWFYNLFACSNCRYTSANYMGGCYVSSNEYGISAVGCTKAGSMLGFDYFTIPLGEDKSIGEAYKTWWVDQVKGSSSDGVISWYYGMTLLGDPVLKVSVVDVNYVKIRDAGGGGGNEVGTVELISGDTLTVWAAGYNAADEYVGEVMVDWSITGESIGVLSDNKGGNTTLTANSTGIGQLLADHSTATDDNTGNITVTTGDVSYVKIISDVDGRWDEVGARSLIFGDTLTVWAGGYNTNDVYIGDVEVDWSITGNAIGTLSDNNGSSTILTATTNGVGQIFADHVSVTDDSTGDITVSAGEIEYVKIRDTAGGGGNEVGTVGLILGDTLQVWAAGYNANGVYLNDISVDWSINGNAVGTLFPVSGTGTSLTVTSTGVGQLVANHSTATNDSTGNISVVPGDADCVKIRDAGGGGGYEVGAAALIIGDTLPVWAAGYNINDVYIGDVMVDWSVTGSTIGTLSEVNGISTTLITTTVGLGRILADHGSATDDSTGDITVIPGSVSYVKIRDAGEGGGNEVGVMSLTLGNILQVWAAGYNTNDAYIGDVTVDWSVTGSTIGTLSEMSGISTTLTAIIVGVGRIFADHVSATDDSTGDITVIPGAVSYVKIRDAGVGVGDKIGARSLIFGDTLPVWAAGYNTNDVYIGDVTVDWSVTGSTIGTLSDNNGSSTILTATTNGVGQIFADHSSATDDSTGDITVSTGGISYMKIRNSAGGGGNEVGTVGLILGDTLQVWAAGYNANGVYLNDVSVDWSISGNAIGTLFPVSGTSTSLTATSTGVGQLVANHSTATNDNTGNITVIPGDVDYVRIRDAGGGGGKEVGTVELIEGDTLPVWAAGYNVNDQYIGEVAVDWSITGNTIGTLSNDSGSDTILTDTTVGVGQLFADHASATDDSTGDITVNVISVSGVPTRPEDEGKYSLQTTVTFDWTQGTVEDSKNGVVGYYVQVGTTPEDNDKFEGDVGNVLNCGIAGCINGNVYYARVKAKNGIGLYSEWSESSDGIMVDTIGPEMNIVKPVHGDTVNGIVDIIVDVSDNIKTEKIEFYINGKMCMVSNDNFSWKWDSSKCEEGKYNIRVKVYDEAGNSNSDEVRVELKGLINYPNPFRAGREETIIGYSLSKDSTVYIGIYDFLGNLVRRWEIRGGEEGGRNGENRISWDGRNGEGKVCANGGYIIRLKSKGIAGGKYITRRIAIVK